jgi:hypothetical protein
MANNVAVEHVKARVRRLDCYDVMRTELTLGNARRPESEIRPQVHENKGDFRMLAQEAVDFRLIMPRGIKESIPVVVVRWESEKRPFIND